MSKRVLTRSMSVLMLDCLATLAREIVSMSESGYGETVWTIVEVGEVRSNPYSRYTDKVHFGIDYSYLLYVL